MKQKKLRKRIFACQDVATRFQRGNLHNENKQDCYIKLEVAEITTTEYCFCTTHFKAIHFAVSGDSGSFVSNILNGSVFGMIVYF